MSASCLIALSLGVLIGLLASMGAAFMLWMSTILFGRSAKNEISIEDKDSE